MSENEPESTEKLDTSDGLDKSPAPKSLPKDRAEARAKAFRMAGLGTELASYTLAPAGIGFLVDSTMGNTKSYATALGTLIGFTFGMFRFIQQVQKNTED